MPVAAMGARLSISCPRKNIIKNYAFSPGLSIEGSLKERDGGRETGRRQLDKKLASGFRTIFMAAFILANCQKSLIDIHNIYQFILDLEAAPA
jgi:hypothetical protein